MTDIKIEKNVPMPVIFGGKANRWVTILETMEVGDSFQLLNGNDTTTLRYSISQYRHRSKTKKDWTVRKVNQQEWRCWRIK